MHTPLRVTLLDYTRDAEELVQKTFGFSYPTPGFDKPVEASVRFASGRTLTLEELGLVDFPMIGTILPGYAKDDHRVTEHIPASAGRFVDFLFQIGHWKFLEILHATFLIEGLSRKSALHLMRYSFLTTNFRSQKYLRQNDFEYVLPEQNEEKASVIAYLEQCYETHQQQYRTLRKMGADPEWQRSVLPNATAQTLSLHTNLRQFRHIFDCLCDEDYVAENRRVAMAMFLELRKVFPRMLTDFSTYKGAMSASRLRVERNVKVNWEMDDLDREALGLYHAPGGENAEGNASAKAPKSDS